MAAPGGADSVGAMAYALMLTLGLVSGLVLFRRQ
jgi:hypothetical protein